MWRLSLALIVAGPGPVCAQVMASAEVRLVAPISPVGASLGAAGSFTPGLTTLSPSLSAPSLSAPSLGAPASLALAPALAAAIPVLPAAVIPAALAASIHPAAAAPVKPAVPGELAATKTALEGLKTEIDAPRPEETDLDGGRDHAAKAFEAKLGIMAYVPEALSAFTEGAFYPLAKIKTPPPASTGDDGGGPTKPRAVSFNGETFPSVAFRPNEPVESLIVHAIETSKESIQIALYEFTSRGILKALLAAKKRGVKVEVILCDTAVNPVNG